MPFIEKNKSNKKDKVVFKMKKMILNLVLASTIMAGCASTAITKSPEQKNMTAEQIDKGYKTEIFLITNEEKDGWYFAPPINRKGGGYAFDKEKYSVGDVVSAQYKDDDVLEEHKVVGKELALVKRLFQKRIDTLSK